MLGGSSRIPLVARRVAEEFGGTPRQLGPKPYAALGAALLASNHRQEPRLPGLARVKD